jgi:hypothetical protein
MAIQLKAGLVCDQRLKKLLALDERQTRDVPTVEMQEIEGVVDEPHTRLAVACRLGVVAARRPLGVTYDPNDLSGAAIGCINSNCRLIQAIGLERQ